LYGLFGNVAFDQVVSVDPGSEDPDLSVIVHMYKLSPNADYFDVLTLRPGTNLSGDDCALIVDDAMTA
jgi:hypothetical protein